MGYIRHHAIVVTGWSEERVAVAQQKARDLGMAVTSIVASPMNGFCSFMVAPDGSKEGWEDSDLGDQQREAFTHALDCMAVEQGEFLEWAEVSYGHDDSSASINRHAWRNVSTDGGWKLKKPTQQGQVQGQVPSKGGYVENP